MRAAIIVHWTGSGTSDDPYRPDLPVNASWSDVTGQDLSRGLPEPNAYTVEARCDDAALAAIAANAHYVVLWSEDEPTEDQAETATETTLLSKAQQTALSNQLQALGYVKADLTSVVVADPKLVAAALVEKQRQAVKVAGGNDVGVPSKDASLGDSVLPRQMKG